MRGGERDMRTSAVNSSSDSPRCDDDIAAIEVPAIWGTENGQEVGYNRLILRSDFKCEFVEEHKSSESPSYLVITEQSWYKLLCYELVNSAIIISRARDR